MADSIGLYLNEIGKVPLLTAGEEKVLARDIEAGRSAAELLASGEVAEVRQAAQDRLGNFTVSATLAVEAKDFISRTEDSETSKEQQQRLASPYFSLLQDVVTVHETSSRALKHEVHRAASAKDRFIRSNLRLVVSIARRYPLPQGMDLGDLIQEGNLGLEHAVDKFDWRRGFKFSTYATFWIRQAIGRALDQKGSLIRLPGDRSAALRAALRSANGDYELLDDANYELHSLTSTASLDKALSDDNEATLGDVIPDRADGPEATIIGAAEMNLLVDLLEKLDKRARYAVDARFGMIDGERKSFREIGEQLGITAEAARRLVARAVATLRFEGQGTDFAA